MNLVLVVLDVQALIGRGATRAASVLAERRFRVGLGAHKQSLLGRFDVDGFAFPRLQDSGLKRTSVRKGQGPWLGARHLVDFVQMQSRFFLRLTTGQEGNTGHRSGHRASQDGYGGFRNLLRRVLFAAFRARHNHVGLEERALQVNLVLGQFLCVTPGQ